MNDQSFQVETPNAPPPAVLASMVKVTAAMAREGISKGNLNKDQKYYFRGIDDIYNALSSHLAESNLVIVPNVISRNVTERPTRNGGVLSFVVLDVEFQIYCATDGSMLRIRVFGEAMDSSDKATNKAMSAAYKYAALTCFCIPTEGDNDADAHSPELASREVQNRQQEAQPARPPQRAPAYDPPAQGPRAAAPAAAGYPRTGGPLDQMRTGRPMDDRRSALATPAPAEPSRLDPTIHARLGELDSDLADCATLAHVATVADYWRPQVKGWPKAAVDAAAGKISQRKAEITVAIEREAAAQEEAAARIDAPGDYGSAFDGAGDPALPPAADADPFA